MVGSGNGPSKCAEMLIGHVWGGPVVGTTRAMQSLVHRCQLNCTDQSGKDRGPSSRKSHKPSRPCHTPTSLKMLKGLVTAVPDGKCVGLLGTELFQKVTNSVHRARDLDYHKQVMPRPSYLNFFLKKRSNKVITFVITKKDSTSMIHKQSHEKDTHASLT